MAAGWEIDLATAGRWLGGPHIELLLCGLHTIGMQEGRGECGVRPLSDRK